MSGQQNMTMPGPPGPPGMPPQTFDPANRGYQLVITTLTMTTLAILVVGGRMYSRFFVHRSAGNDDWCMLGAMVFIIGTTVLHVVMVKVAGSGSHTMSLPKEKMILQHKMGMAAMLLYLPLVMFIRVSILLFVRRLSPGRVVRFNAALLIAVNVVYAITTLFLLVFQCTPLDQSFFSVPAFRRQQPKCIGSPEKMQASVSYVAPVMDFAVWLVVVGMVSSIQKMSWKKKLRVIALLGLGLVACIPAALRIPRMKYFVQDPSWEGITFTILVIIEESIGVITASIPAVYSLIVPILREKSTSDISDSNPSKPKAFSGPSTLYEIEMEGEPADETVFNRQVIPGHSESRETLYPQSPPFPDSHSKA